MEFYESTMTTRGPMTSIQFQLACPVCGHISRMWGVGGKSLWLLNQEDTFREDYFNCQSIKADEVFRVHLRYHKPSKCFVFSIWTAKSQNIASQYKADLVIEGANSKLCFEGLKVLSVEENIRTTEKLVEEAGNISMCIPRNLAMNMRVKHGIYEYLNVTFSFKKI